jgi:hypothetical protein
MSTHGNTLTHIQDIFFDVNDLLSGQTYQELGYLDQADMLREFRWKLERIEKEFRTLAGLDQENV